MRSVHTAALVCSLLALFSSAAPAAPLPYTQVELGAHSAAGPDLVSDQFGTIESSFAGSAARATAGTDPAASLYAQVGRSSGTTAGESTAYAHERYWFEILGPDGTVSVDLSGQGRVSIHGPFAMGGGVASAISVGAEDGSFIAGGCTGGYRPQPCDHSPSLSPFSFSGSYDLQANTPYYVDLWVYTFLPPGYGSSLDIAWASASMAQPMFSQGFAGAGAYAFSYSSPVPEPGALALAGVGLGAVALLRRRRRAA